MDATRFDGTLEVFSTCPPSNQADLKLYLSQVIDIARWSERCGCKGILVYSDNSQLDAWLIAESIIRHTTSLCPLIAVQPIYMHPYAVAKTVTSIGSLSQRQVYLNMVAGGFKNDLVALNDATPHDRRYDRLVEYTQIVMRLLEDSGPLSFNGEFYQVDKLKLTPPLAPGLFPGVFVSGSSGAGLAAAHALGATAIKYPKPADQEPSRQDDSVRCGMRVGIVARSCSADAWDAARARFPENRKGQLTRQLATKVSDSVWHKQLSALEEQTEENPYWLVPFQNYKTMCPYLVGSYEEVAEELTKYLMAGYRTVILDVPGSPEEMAHTAQAFALAMQPVQ